MSFKTLNNLAGWLVFAIAAVVLGVAAEPTGSLWDCGEFISGAYKLQVVHPPGAPIFLVIGRLFTWVASMVSDNPANIAYSVNLLSALCSAAAAMFICWSTTIVARMTMTGREGELSLGQSIAIAGGGVVAGLTTAFCTSIWFSAVEGEVYSMSTFFTCLTLWASMKWYFLPDNSETDRWLVFAFFATALSIGVHLLSLLTFPALAMLYYFKKAKNRTIGGTFLAAFVGLLFIIGIQTLIIAGIPNFWAKFDRLFVNSFGFPIYSGIIAVLLIFGGAITGGLLFARASGSGLLQRLIVSLALVILAYFAYGTVIIRAEANTPINMNDPSDPLRLLPYLNREQYGERPLVSGPSFEVKPIDVNTEPRYGRVIDKNGKERYAVVDEKVDYKYPSGSNTLFPRMGDNSQGRPRLYRNWINKPTGPITFADNLEFFWKYQINWMWWRYFMWNFSGRQNGDQGVSADDPTAGHWITGIDAIDERKIGNQEMLPEMQKNNQAKNRYYAIPFILGIVGFFFQLLYRKSDDKILIYGGTAVLGLAILSKIVSLLTGEAPLLSLFTFILMFTVLFLSAIKRAPEAAALITLFVITGLGIIVYSNQPPSEPRERDYVLVGCFFTFAIWVGMSVPALYELFKQRLKLPDVAGAGLGLAVGMIAPLLMVTQNWDDHNRSTHTGSRDYATNFLQSCQPNAIIFTYGDNDTYPLWYCQEVEHIRTDVRVVNLSLIAVDWYINQLRRKVNNSPAIKMTIPAEQIRGFKRVQTPYLPPANGGGDRPMLLSDVVKFLGEDHQDPRMAQFGDARFETYLPTRLMYIPINKQEIYANNVLSAGDSAIVDTIYMNLGDKTTSVIKDQLALLDIVSSNIWERPIYWAVTCREDRLLGLEDYLQLEGLGLRLVPVKSKGQGEYGILGSGRVNTDMAYQNIMEKWAWGNFDKERLYVDRSYLPSLQTMKMSMIRVSRQLLVEGKKDKAIALADKFFEVFPHMNFQYDQFSAMMADVYGRAGATDKGAAKIRDIAKSVEEQLVYIDSQSPQFKPAFQQDLQFALGTAQTLLGAADAMKDEALSKELEGQFMKYVPPQQPRQELPGLRK